MRRVISALPGASKYVSVIFVVGDMIVRYLVGILVYEASVNTVLKHNDKPALLICRKEIENVFIVESVHDCTGVWRGGEVNIKVSRVCTLSTLNIKI